MWFYNTTKNNLNSFILTILLNLIMNDQQSIEFRKNIGDNFKKIRKQKKLSLRKIEAITGVDHSWIGKFEKGLINFEIDTLHRLIDGLTIHPKKLFDFEWEFKE